MNAPSCTNYVAVVPEVNGDNHVPIAFPNTNGTDIDIDNNNNNNNDYFDKPLFSLDYISPEVQSLLPENYTLRPLRRSDYYSGYLDVLRVLTSVGDFSIEKWNERYDWMAQRNGEYFLLVVCDGEERVVGTGSLIVERKFIRSLGMVGHIEDIAIEQGQQGKKLGLRMIQALDYVANKVGCYKVCSSSFLPSFPDLSCCFLLTCVLLTAEHTRLFRSE